MRPKHLLCVLFFSIFFTAFAGSSFAESYDLKSDTPEIKNAIGSRQTRYNELVRLKASGLIGEDNQGYVKAMTSEMQSIANAENEDRRTIYQAIVTQNQLGRDGMSHVQTAFAEVQRHKARNGDPIQQPSGEWIRK